jgi:hypothetical protein
MSWVDIIIRERAYAPVLGWSVAPRKSNFYRIGKAYKREVIHRCDLRATDYSLAMYPSDQARQIDVFLYRAMKDPDSGDNYSRRRFRQKLWLTVAVMEWRKR